MVRLVVLALVFTQMSMVRCGTVQLYRPCAQTSECIPDVGLSCVFTWTTCSHGMCQCSDTDVWDKDRCQPKLTIGSTCTSTRTLPKNSTCANGKLSCEEGYSPFANKQCLRGTKSLGEGCGSSSDCYDIYADCRFAPGASSKTCVCETNYKNVNSICRKAKLGEACAVAGNCESGSMECGSSKTCTCKATLQSYEGTCIAAGTTKVNQTCTAANPTCELGLSCTACPGEGDTRCLKISTPEPKRNSGHGFSGFTFGTIILAVAASMLGQ